MKKKTVGWDKSFQKMTVSKEVLRGDLTMFLLLEGAGYITSTDVSFTPPTSKIFVSASACQMFSFKYLAPFSNERS